MRTVLEFFKIQRGRIVLFSKGCPNSSCPICTATIPGGRAGRGRSPPCRCITGSCHPYRLATNHRACMHRPLRAGLSSDLAVGGRPCIGAGRGWPPLLLAAFAA
ncbi:hypothetical protein BHE74_00058971 [Ensete ventricosum]|nr:hypothetical protein GW17_00060127 [Ensete ventricosum]RWW36032.1 hypothetical protein BHE74_00058971 [Ensete ventricosum]